MQKRRPLILPPIVQKRQQQTTVVVVISALPMIGVITWGLVTDTTSLTSLNLAIQAGMIAFVGSLAVVAYTIVWFLKLTARVAREGGAACVYCGYSLAGLGEAGACPECSRPFTLAEAMTLWKNARLRPSKRRPWSPPEAECDGPR